MATHHEKRMREFLEGGFHEQVVAFYDLNLSGLGQNLRVLDFGAGSGLVSLSLADKDYTGTITACDRNLDCMRELPDRQKIVKRPCTDSRALPFDAGSFDAVVCRFTFHYIEHKMETLKEFRRVMTESGILLYSDPVLPEHSKTVLNPLYYIREDHFHGYLGYHETIELMGQSGFQVILARPYKYRYASFGTYLEGVDDGLSEDVPHAFSGRLKSKLETAWKHLDEKTKREMGVELHNLSSGLSYHVLDLALKKSQL